MPDDAKTVIVMLAAGFLILASDLVQVRRERKKKKWMHTEEDRQTAAIWYAMGKVSGRVELGVYQGSDSKDAAMDDLELYKIEFLESVMPR